MESTVDLAGDTPTTWQTETYSSEEDMTTAALRLFPKMPRYLLPFTATLIVFGVLGALANVSVVAGLCLAGRSKMNSNSVYIANHAALMLFSYVMNVAKFSVDVSGVLLRYHFSGPAGWTVCIIKGGVFIVIAVYGARACVIIHTLDRYWQIVHPVHHRKYYRRWMTKVGVVVPWLLGFIVKSIPTIVTTRIVRGRCLPRAWSSPQTLQVCSHGFNHSAYSFFCVTVT